MIPVLADVLREWPEFTIGAGVGSVVSAGCGIGNGYGWGNAGWAWDDMDAEWRDSHPRVEVVWTR